MFKRKLAGWMIGSLMVTTLQVPLAGSAQASAPAFTDIDGSYAKDAIVQLANAGIITGSGNGHFNPTAPITRQDFSIILAKALNLDTSNPPAAPTFSDIPKDNYAYSAVEAAAKAGLVQGMGNGIFGKNQNLSRQDMAVLLGRSLEYTAGSKLPTPSTELTFSDASSIADYAKDSVALCFSMGLFSGNPDGTFNPLGSSVRQDAAKVASLYVNKIDEIKAAANPTPTPTATPSPTPTPTPTQTPPIPSSTPSNPVSPIPDPSAPLPAISDVSATVTGTTYGTLSVTTTNAAKLHYVLLSEEAAAPSSEQIKAGQSGSVTDSVYAHDSYSITDTASYTTQIQLQELSSNKSYMLYVTGENAAGILSPVSSLRFTTLAQAVEGYVSDNYVLSSSVSTGLNIDLQFSHTHPEEPATLHYILDDKDVDYTPDQIKDDSSDFGFQSGHSFLPSSPTWQTISHLTEGVNYRLYFVIEQNNQTSQAHTFTFSIPIHNN